MSANLETAAMGRKKFASLGEVVDFNPRFGKDELADDSLASFVPMKCVEEESGRFEPLGDRKVAEVRKGYTPFRDGDVIFAKVTPCMENGKAAVLKGLTNGVGFGSTEFFALRPKTGLDADYLLHFLLQRDFRKEAARNMTGAVGLRRVPKAYLEQRQIPLPPLPEQRRIVAEIEKQFTRLEAGVAALRRVQANLKRYRAAVLKAACEGRLVPTEAELAKTGKRKAKFETGEDLLARILTERRHNWQGRGQYKEPYASETVCLPVLPEGWTWAAFNQVCETVSDEGKKLAKGNYLPEGQIPVIDQGETFIGGFSNDETLAFTGALPVILFGDHTRRFKLGKERFIVGADGVKLIGLSAVWDAKFLWYQFQQLDFEDRGYSRHFQFVRRAPLRLPPLLEQTRIVAEVERRLSVVEELESAVSANLQRATRLRQSILQKAFSGRLLTSR